MKNIVLVFTLIFTIPAFSLEVPQLTGPVVDTAGVISSSAEMESQIRALYKEGAGPQVNILTISTLNGEDLEQYANKVFSAWKLGDLKRDDGVLFLIVVNDRKMRIEVGQGLEGGLTDLQSKRILGSLKPYFRNQDYSGGIQHGLSQIISAVSKPDAVQQPTSPKHNSTSSTDNKEVATFFVGALLLLIGFGICYVVFAYFQHQRTEIAKATKQLLNLQSHESEINRKTQTLKEKINYIESDTKLSIKNATLKVKQESASLNSVLEKKHQEVHDLSLKEATCPMSQLETLIKKKHNLNMILSETQRNIRYHEGVLSKEGK